LTTDTREILRQASVALGGLPVWLWEVAERARLAPQLSSDPDTDRRPPDVDLYTTIERWNISVEVGSRWVGSRVWADGPWVLAPVREHPPAPPPEGRERRSRERMTLELAGLCVGLGQRDGIAAALDAGAFPVMVVHELGNPLAAARAALELVIEAIGRGSDIPAATRLEILEELGLVNDDIDRAVSFLRSLQGRRSHHEGN
jgi:signal transduction histidine kinase